jgi:hypothetical protein
MEIKEINDFINSQFKDLKFNYSHYIEPRNERSVMQIISHVFVAHKTEINTFIVTGENRYIHYLPQFDCFSGEFCEELNNNWLVYKRKIKLETL